MLNLIDLVDNEEKQISIEELKESKLHNAWLDVKDPSDHELKALVEKLDVSKNLIKPTEVPTFSSIRLLENLAIFYFSTFSGEFDQKNLSSLIVIFSKTFIVTIRMEDMHVIAKAKVRLHKAETDTPSYVLYIILDEVINGYYSYVEMVDEQSSRFEENIIEHPSEDLFKQVIELKSKLTTFSRMLWYERSVLYILKRSNLPFITDLTKLYLDELIDDLTKQIDSVSIFREVLTDAMNSYRAAISHELNIRIEKLSDVVKVLTSLTVLVAIPTLIFTYYGQNFPLPEFQTLEANYVVTGATIVLAIIVVLLFKKKGWL